ncbi:Ankyrin repeat-containing protein [Artemisia annua]|uniref:Ankyrin repeat-containing protein n=1 Tax=Artemisia annua TaxID=35608 RepID=A0A2U1KAF5_ARTAN|nr:Ankyrin repeat-containing protein [Artemisia annua]
MHASNANVSNFVSVKLSGESKYNIWKAQMLCLMGSQKMRGIVDSKYQGPGATTEEIKKQYDRSSQSWIFGSLSEDVLSTVIDLESRRACLEEAKVIYDPEISTAQGSASQVLGTGTATQIVTVKDTANEDNTRRYKRLRKAIVEGRWWKAEGILKNHKDAATEAISNDGNTMLHIAVGIGKNDFVRKLLNFIDDGKQIEKQNADGCTALHIAAIVGNKHAAELLVKKRKELLGISDHKAFVPLLSAYYNMQLNTFVYLLEANDTKQQPLPLGLNTGSGVQTGVNLLITAIYTKQYDLALRLVDIYPELATNDDQVLTAIAKTFPSELDFGEALIYPSLHNFHRKIVNTSSFLFFPFKFLYTRAEDIIGAIEGYRNTCYSWFLPEIFMIILAAVFYLIYQLVLLLLLLLCSPFFVVYFILWKVLATLVGPIKRIEKKKKDYKEAKKILNSVCDQIDKLSFSGGHHPCYRRPILEATCQGAYQVVDEILFRSPKAIDSKNENGLNIIQLAVINRSEKIYNLVYHIVERTDLYRTSMDSSKNNILHLVGRLAPSRILSRTTGAALQLQRELQWREEVQKFVFPTYLTKENIFKETPEMVFTREHMHLVKEGEQWMKTTAESCSITAALIITIVFAAAITVPGGSTQETGIPLFTKEVAFTIFAVSDAISLFSSTTALLVFLSILTARFSEKDFLLSLPRRLILGLCALFLSTTAMIVAFSATLFLVFCDQRAWMLGPIGGLACFPIIVFVTLQFPLVVDLFRSTYFPIFGKQRYIECGKFNPNDIQSFFGNRAVE